jgi:FtsP/CotA-like multicopper oxidase with cupredoxin domain
MRRSLVVVLVLASAASVVVTVPLAALAAFTAYAFAAPVDTTGRADFSRELRIPPVAEGTRAPDGTRIFDLRLQAGSTDFGFGGPTRTWGVNGSYLGPTLRAKRGDRVAVRVHNDLPEPTSVHWHGMHLPAVMDGGPHQEVAPGATWRPHWRIDQGAATLWYHPHPHGRTAAHIYRGLAGMFILDDPGSTPDGLPQDYGVDDIPVIVQDRDVEGTRFDEDAGLFRSTGLLGDTILVNGTVTPRLDVTAATTRLRLLNASNARIYDFAVSDRRSLTVIGSDGGLLPRAVDVRHLRLSPGERVEVLLRMDPGERVVLRSLPQDLGADPWNQRLAGGNDRLDVMELRAADRLTPSAEVPARLAPAPDLANDDAARHRTFQLSGTSINGQRMDMGRIDVASVVGTTEVWEVLNTDGGPHNFHVHDAQFQVLARGGRDPSPLEAGWKDTVYLVPGQEVALAVRFEDYTDPGIPYMFHCHLLRHEDRGMMGQFVVVQPGEGPKDEAADEAAEDAGSAGP